MQGTLLAQFKQEAKARMAVLQKLSHINAEGTVQLKGRAACEIDTSDELLSTGAAGCVTAAMNQAARHTRIFLVWLTNALTGYVLSGPVSWGNVGCVKKALLQVVNGLQPIEWPQQHIGCRAECRHQFRPRVAGIMFRWQPPGGR